MSQETFFTFTEYKQNYDKLKDEFVNAYIVNDEEEFISLQMACSQRCLENTTREHGFASDSIGWFSKSLFVVMV